MCMCYTGTPKIRVKDSGTNLGHSSGQNPREVKLLGRHPNLRVPEIICSLQEQPYCRQIQVREGITNAFRCVVRLASVRMLA